MIEAPMSAINWSRLRDQCLVALCGIAFVAVAAWVLAHGMKIILLVLLAILPAYALDPLLRRLDRFVPRGVAALLSYLVAILLLAALGYVLLKPLIAQATSLSSQLPAYFDRTASSVNALAGQYGVSLPPADQARNQLGSSAQGAIKEILFQVIGLATSFANAVVDVVLVLFFAFWFMVDGGRMRKAFNRLFPRHYQERVLFVEDTVSQVLGGYIRAQLTMAAII